MYFLKKAGILLAFACSSVSCDTIADIVSSTDDFTVFFDLAISANLTSILAGEGPLALFSPTNAAFGKLESELVTYLTNTENIEYLQAVLRNHIVNGNVLSIEESDIQATNGVVRVIDTVLIPQRVLSTYAASTKTIVDIAIDNPEFSTLVSLVIQAGLVDVLSSDGPFTLFAPTNAAFDKLSSDVIDFLTDLDNVETLQDVLNYHVLGGASFASDLIPGEVPTALTGKSISVSLNPIKINDAIVTAADTAAKNGVIHTISSVLVPEDLSLSMSDATCIYYVAYPPGTWVMGDTLVCQCDPKETRLWVSCTQLYGSCGRSCNTSQDCSGVCSICDANTSMCVPHDSNQRYLRSSI